MGIGGGWYEHEWRLTATGSRPRGCGWAGSTRACRSCVTPGATDEVSFNGKHYQVDGAIVAPKPLQDGGPPLWIAGGGEKVTLKIAAKYAQYTNFTSEPDAFAHKSQVLADHCRDVGTDYDAIVRSANFNAVVGESEADVEERIDRIRARQVSRVNEQAVDAMLGHREVTRIRQRHTGTGRREAEADARARLRVRDPLLPRGRLRPLGHRAVRAEGHPRAQLVA